jgi:hypothetical protein
MKYVRKTFDNREIRYNELSHQHLSNIVWFNKVFFNANSTVEKNLLSRKFNSELLPYHPHESFEAECRILSARGYLKPNGDIYFDGTKIGERIPC